MNSMRCLVFGEDQYDCQTIAEIVSRFFDGRLEVQVVNKPIILNATEASKEKMRGNIDRVEKAIKVFMKKKPYDFVIVHRDADAVELHHVSIASALEQDFSRRLQIPVVPAVPAWETEAWLLLFPGSIAARRKCWNDVGKINNVGSIKNAKEFLRRKTRSKKKSCPDYRESDAPDIARNIPVPISNANDCLQKSASLRLFVSKIEEQFAQSF